MYKKLDGLVSETVVDSHSKSERLGASEARWLSQTKVEPHFVEGLVANFHLRRRKGFLDFLVSVLGHSLIVALLILLPLCFTGTINMGQFQKTLLVAPPPPPPPAPPAAMHVIPRPSKSFFMQGRLFAPKLIPKQIAQVREEPPAQTLGGALGGVPGGVPGGQLGGVLGGILGSNRQYVPAPPPPPRVAHKGPYRVGGIVRAPKLIQQIQPIYPALAKEARIQGDVVIDSVIDQQGEVTQMKVVSGSPVLVQAAMQAVEKWKYQPTLLNGHPVAVDMLVTVHFQLGDAS